MPSESSIKQAEILLAQLANKQAFLDSLRPVDKKTEPKITVTVQKVTTVFVPGKETDAYWSLLDTLYFSTRKDIDMLTRQITEILNFDNGEIIYQEKG